jgi:hypothetical protein
MNKKQLAQLEAELEGFRHFDDFLNIVKRKPLNPAKIIGSLPLSTMASVGGPLLKERIKTWASQKGLKCFESKDPLPTLCLWDDNLLYQFIRYHLGCLPPS